MFLVGQTLPVTEVYGPQSRKANIFCKNRLEVAAYRLFQKKDNKSKRIPISKILSMFPQFPELVIRKWLKDTSDYVRVGRDMGWWVLNKDAPTLSEEELRVQVTPEMVCCYESMLAGKQRLIDAGYFNAIEEQFEEEDNADATVDDEVKLAPWHTSRNFILATQGKALVELIGPGDPTTRGEGFSFIRIPLKSTFHRRWMTEPLPNSGAGSKFSIAQQQQAYREQIMKIWDAQYTALVSTAELPESEVESYKRAQDEHEAQLGGGGGGGGGELDDESRSILSSSQKGGGGGGGGGASFRESEHHKTSGKDRFELEHEHVSLCDSQSPSLSGLEENLICSYDVSC